MDRNAPFEVPQNKAHSPLELFDFICKEPKATAMVTPSGAEPGIRPAAIALLTRLIPALFAVITSNKPDQITETQISAIVDRMESLHDDARDAVVPTISDEKVVGEDPRNGELVVMATNYMNMLACMVLGNSVVPLSGEIARQLIPQILESAAMGEMGGCADPTCFACQMKHITRVELQQTEG